jgi:tryptophan-rich sensory protein
MVIYAYLTGSSITTSLFYVGYLTDYVYFGTRYAENLPAIVEMYGRVAVPFWVPPVTQIDLATFMLNLVFGLVVLLVWTARYDSATRRRAAY